MVWDPFVIRTVQQEQCEKLINLKGIQQMSCGHAHLPVVFISRRATH